MDNLPQEVLDIIVQHLLPCTAQIPQRNDTRSKSKVLGSITASVRRLRTRFGAKAKTKTKRQGDSSTTTNRPPSLAPLATVSRPWQAAVERVLFAEVFITSHEVQDFAAVFSSRSRRKHVQAVTYTALMPPEQRTMPNTAGDFTTTIESPSNTAVKLLFPLFAVLSSWDQGPCHLRLGVAPAVPTTIDNRRIRYPVYPVCIPEDPILPVVSCVRRLSLYPVRSTTYRFPPHSQRRLVSRFPNLQDVAWYIEHEPVAALDFYLRHTFALSLTKCLEDRPIPKMTLGLGSSLHGLRLDCQNCWIKEDHDPFLAELRTATANVSEFCYSGWIDESFFWPPGEDNAEDENNSNSESNKNGAGGDGCHQHRTILVPPQPPVWHSMRHLTVCMSLLTPKGKWYFDHRREMGPYVDTGHLLQDINTPAYWPPSEESRVSGVAEPVNDPMDNCLFRLPRDENWQRRYPKDETMNPLLLSFARLLESGTMSLLQTAHIVARRGLKAKPWVVCYCAPRSTSRYVQFSKVDIDRPRVWLVTEQWEPSSEVMDLFRKAGRAIHHQDAAVIKWKNPYTPFEGFRMR